MFLTRNPYESCAPFSSDTQPESRSHEKLASEAPVACRHDGCTKPFVGFFNAKPSCPEHIIKACYQKLDNLTSDLRAAGSDEGARSGLRRELGQIVDQIYAVSLSPESLDRFEQIKLLEILENAGLIFSRIRRSDRVARSVAIRLLPAARGETWSEETNTHTLSRHGAALRYSRRLQGGQILTIERLDTKMSTRARVVSKKDWMTNGAVLAVEILSKGNFWAPAFER